MRSGGRVRLRPSPRRTRGDRPVRNDPLIELVGTSTKSWEKAAAVAKAGESLRELRIAEVSELDLQIENGSVRAYRAKLKVSFKYEGGD